jgi:hypothetical protein
VWLVEVVLLLVVHLGGGALALECHEVAGLEVLLRPGESYDTLQACAHGGRGTGRVCRGGGRVLEEEEALAVELHLGQKGLAVREVEHLSLDLDGGVVVDHGRAEGGAAREAAAVGVLLEAGGGVLALVAVGQVEAHLEEGCLDVAFDHLG